MRPYSLGESALVVVDMQRGFSPLCPNELPIVGSLEIIPLVNCLLQVDWRQIHASQDWHPANHRSFLGQRDNYYPPHCVQGTAGAEFLPGLRAERFQAIWRKGYQVDFEAYAVTAQHPQFGSLLIRSGIRRVFVCGLATNICCFFTARDLYRDGLEVSIIEDASAGIDVPSASLFQADAKREGQALGIEYACAADVLSGTTR
jgi:nicotinamidase/pyrazinamidase